MPKRIFSIKQTVALVELFKLGNTNFSELARYCQDKWGIKTCSYSINKLITREANKDEELKAKLEEKRNPNLLKISRVSLQNMKYYERDRNKSE